MTVRFFLLSHSSQIYVISCKGKRSNTMIAAVFVVVRIGDETLSEDLATTTKLDLAFVVFFGL